MKKRFLALLMTAALILTLLPATASAASTLVVDGSTYAVSEAGLNAAITAASDGDTIKITASGTITLTADMSINKSITLDLNKSITLNLNGHKIDFTGSFGAVQISSDSTIQGPGTIATKRYITVSGGSTLTVQGGAVIEGMGTWQPLMNSGTVSMTEGALRQKNGNYVLLNSASGTATFDNVTIETSNASGSVIWAADYSTLTLNNCTTRNNYSGTISGTLPSVIYVTHSAAVTLNGGSVTAPAGSTKPAIKVGSDATLIVNGAVINGYVIKSGDLSVSVSSGAGKVTLAPQTAEPGVTYYYKTTAADDTAAKPHEYGTFAFNAAGWTAFSTATDIATASTATVYVQVVKVGYSDHIIYGWGQGSAVPTAAPTPTPTATPTPMPTLTATPTPSASPKPTVKPTVSPTPTEKPTPTPSASPKPTVRPTVSPTPTEKPTPVPSVSPTPTVKPTVSPTPTVKPTPVPSTKPKPTEAPTAKATPTAALIAAPSTTATPTPAPTTTQTPAETEKTNMRTIKGTLLDSNGNPMAGYVVELHSDPMTAITDADGGYAFDGVDYTSHALIMKTPAGNKIAEFGLTFSEGDEFSTEVTEKGVSITYTHSTETVNIEVKLIPDQSGAAISQVSGSDNPRTDDALSGGISVLWWIAGGVIVLLLIALLIIILLKKRNEDRKSGFKL